MRGGDDLAPAWLAGLVSATTSVTAQDLSRFAAVPDGVTAKESAVLIALSESAQGPRMLLLERAATMRNHGGQAAFPGGARDSTDRDLVHTALREAQEEVGLNPDSVEVMVQMPALFLPPSSFLVTPVLAWWHEPHDVGVVDDREVARVVNAELAELADPANRFRVVHPSGFRGPGFQAGGLFIWGFTAGLVDAVLSLGGWWKPWDESVERLIP